MAIALSTLRPDAIGLNFYAPSSRYIDPHVAEVVRRAIADDVLAIGVFVNSTIEEICSLHERLDFDGIQLHGDETLAFANSLRELLPDRILIRAYRVDETGLGELQRDFETSDAPFDAILVDARVGTAYGGTGHVAPWDLLQNYADGWPPLILAGGLHDQNVSEAIRTARPAGVDTAGGIESSPAVKDIERARRFLHAVRSTQPSNPP